MEKIYINSTGMEFVLIPAGSFTMGVPPTSVSSSSDFEAVVHTVIISKPFYLGKYQVTQAQWMEQMGNNPSMFTGRENPVERVSWDDAQAFIALLNTKEGHGRYRLPSEAEWEHAARAGTATRYFFGDTHDDLVHYAWYWENSDDVTHPVGLKQPNPWGLYDICGNVWEWVHDWEGDNPRAVVTDPEESTRGFCRVVRGGSWNSSSWNCSPSTRNSAPPESRLDGAGFRLVLSLEEAMRP